MSVGTNIVTQKPPSTTASQGEAKRRLECGACGGCIGFRKNNPIYENILPHPYKYKISSMPVAEKNIKGAELLTIFIK